MINSNKTRRNEEALRIGLPKESEQSGRCDFAGCTRDGLYKAPKAPRRLRDYYFFCLEHVREYNKSWNYNAGLSERELEESIRRSTTWERPSWPFGAQRTYFSNFEGDEIRDIFGFFDDDHVRYRRSRSHRDPQPGNGNFSELELEALEVMELKLPIDGAKLKSRYKYLAKLNHPDRNGGDKDAEERLKLINEAYTTLKQFLTAN